VSEPVYPQEAIEISAEFKQKITDLVNRAGQLEQEMAELEEQVSVRSKELQAIIGGWQSPGALVELLEQAGTMDVTTLEGIRVIIDEELKAPSMGANSKYKSVVLDWARKAGHGGVIKGELVVNLPKGLPDETVKQLESNISNAGLQSRRDETINSQTLAALLRELLEAGADVPLDQLGATVFKRANIVLPKKRV